MEDPSHLMLHPFHIQTQQHRYQDPCLILLEGLRDTSQLHNKWELWDHLMDYRHPRKWEIMCLILKRQAILMLVAISTISLQHRNQIMQLFRKFHRVRKEGARPRKGNGTVFLVWSNHIGETKSFNPEQSSWRWAIEGRREVWWAWVRGNSFLRCVRWVRNTDSWTRMIGIWTWSPSLFSQMSQGSLCIKSMFQHLHSHMRGDRIWGSTNLGWSHGLLMRVSVSHHHLGRWEWNLSWEHLWLIVTSTLILSLRRLLRRWIIQLIRSMWKSRIRS